MQAIYRNFQKTVGMRSFSGPPYIGIPIYIIYRKKTLVCVHKKKRYINKVVTLFYFFVTFIIEKATLFYFVATLLL